MTKMVETKGMKSGRMLIEWFRHQIMVGCRKGLRLENVGRNSWVLIGRRENIESGMDFLSQFSFISETSTNVVENGRCEISFRTGFK